MDKKNQSSEIIDEEIKIVNPGDYKVLLHAILKQAMDDYIKLQHPKFRKKLYLQEAFDSAVELLFNSDYRMLYVKNDMGEDLSLRELVTMLLDDSRADIKRLKEHVIQEARTFWETKLVRTLYLPENFIYDGHVYSVHHTDDFDPTIDFDKKEISINKKRGSESEQQFLCVTIDIIFYHEDIPATKDTRDKLCRALFRMLKINSCFTGS